MWLGSRQVSGYGVYQDLAQPQAQKLAAWGTVAVRFQIQIYTL